MPVTNRLSSVAWLGQSAASVTDTASTDGSVLLIPVGALEQHGPHLPTGTDTVLAEAVTMAAAEKLADRVPVLVTPPVWAGVSPHHRPFGGTVDAGVESLRDSLLRVLNSAADNEFDAVILINGHGGNENIVGAVTQEAGHKHPELLVSSLFYLDLAEETLQAVRESEVTGVHSGEVETSLMLHVAPDTVEIEHAETVIQSDPNPHTRDDLFDTGPLSVYRSYDEYTDTGSVGDPTRATAKKGARLFDAVIDELGAVVESLHREAQSN